MFNNAQRRLPYISTYESDLSQNLILNKQDIHLVMNSAEGVTTGYILPIGYSVLLP